jgi:radical SAM protein with 4Fe4S-binding SPASM domain
MPFEQFKKIVDEFAQMGGLHITITGGEALLHKNIIDMLNYCRAKDLEITLLSNLISLSDDIIVALKRTNVNMVNVSLYSTEDEVHDYITKVKGSCEKTKSAIELLVKNNIPVQISCPVLKPNKNNVAEVINYAKQLKTKASIDYNIVAQKDLQRDNLDSRLSLDEIRLVIEQIVKNRSDYVRFLDETPLDSDKSNPGERPCGAAYSTLNISSNGDINPCSTWGISLGNIFESSLNDIWLNSEKIKEIRRVTFADFPKCQKCEYADYCMTCMAKNYTENGDSMKLNTYFCEIARINKEVVDKWKHNRL